MSSKYMIHIERRPFIRKTINSYFAYIHIYFFIVFFVFFFALLTSCGVAVICERVVINEDVQHVQ